MTEKKQKPPLNRNVASPRSFVNFKNWCIQMSLTVLCLLAILVLQSCSNPSETRSTCSLTSIIGQEDPIKTDDIVALPKNGDNSTVTGDLSNNYYWTAVQVPKAIDGTAIAFNYDPRYAPPAGPPTPYALAYTKDTCPLTPADQSYMIMQNDMSLIPINYVYTESTMTFRFTSPGDYTIISAPATRPPTGATVTRNKSTCSLTFGFGREFTIETDDVINLPNNGAGFSVNGNLSDNHYWTVVQVPNATNQTTIAFNYDPRYVPPAPPMPGVTVGPYALVYSKTTCPLTVTDQSYMIMPDFSIMQTNYDYTESTMTVSFTSPGDYTIISAPTIQSAMAAVTRNN